MMEKWQLVVIVCAFTEESGTSMLVVCAEVFVASLLLQACLQTLCFVSVFVRCVVWSWDSIVSIIIIIIFINCSWVVTQWQWLFYIV